MSDECEICITDHPKARKIHRCGECGGMIQVGEVYNKYHGVEGGEGFTHKVCVDCNTLVDRINAGRPPEEWVYFGGLSEFAGEEGIEEFRAFIAIMQKRGAKIRKSFFETLAAWEEAEKK